MAKIYTRPNSPYWWTRYLSPDGSEVRRSLKVQKTKGFKEIAQLKASEMEIEHWQAWKSGKLDRPQHTFDELMIGWINETDPGSADITNIKILKRVFGGCTLEAITGKDIADCKRTWRSAGLSNNTIRRRLSTFSSAWNYARSEWEWDVVNPIAGRLPAEEEYEADHLTYEQAQKFFDALQRRQFQPYNAPHLLDFCVLAVNTAMRKTELLSCRLDQIDRDNSCIHLKRKEQKGRKRTATPLNSEALAAIEHRLTYIAEKFPDTKWLFPNPRTKGREHIRDVKTAFNTIREEIGCPNLRIQDLRHTSASWLVQRGRTLYEVSKVLRHSSVKPTQRYAHLELEHLRQTVDEFDAVPVDFRLDNDDDDRKFNAKKRWQEALRRKQRKAHSAHSSHTEPMTK